MQTIDVWYNGMILTVYKSVADRLNLRHGQHIRTEEQFCEVINANASFGISLCQHEMEADVKQN